VGLSELFGRLQDADKSARYAAKAYDLSRSLQLGDLNSRHHRAALLQMASALRKQGELGDAHDYCSVSNWQHLQTELLSHRRVGKFMENCSNYKNISVNRIAKLWRGVFCSLNTRQHFDLYFGNPEKKGLLRYNILLCQNCNQNRPKIMLQLPYAPPPLDAQHFYTNYSASLK
jgi:hypothetical protein